MYSIEALRNRSASTKNMAAKLKDIAQKLNLSISTVSYALNGGPRTVSAEVRDRVLIAARELEYRPNRVARSLMTGRSHTVGVVPTEAVVHLALTPYFQSVLNGIINSAEETGNDVLIFTRFDQSNVDMFADTLLDGRADGLIFLAPLIHSPIFEAIESSGIPYVVTSSPTGGRAVCFAVDNAEGVTTALNHLTSLGHRKIGHIRGTRRVTDGVVRAKAFEDYAMDNGLEVRAEWMLDGDFTPTGGYQAGKQILASKDRPTAVFCSNDEMAAGFARACYELGVRIPQDISLMGFDDAPICQLLFPQLTTIRQPLEEMGAAAYRTLVSLVDGEDASSSQLFPTQLIKRTSTDRPKEDIS